MGIPVTAPDILTPSSHPSDDQPRPVPMIPDAGGAVVSPRVEILVGDVRERLRDIPTASIDCCVTSPPYWGLRNYGVEGQIGLERTLGEHIAVLVDVFRDVRRVLKAQGTCWLNYGDCYAAAPNGKSAAAYKADGSDDRTFRDKPFSTVGAVYEPDDSQRQASRRGRSGNLGNCGINGAGIPNGRIVAAGGFLKPKDLCMVANRLAIALQDDGWWVRSEIIWHKPNPMPESVYDRPTSAHEKIWLLTKSEDYFYNHEAIREPVTGGSHSRVRGKETHGRHTLGDALPEGERRKIKVPGGWDVEKGSHGTINRSGRTEATYVERKVGPNSRQNVDRTPVSRKLADPGSGTKSNSSFSPAITEIVSDTRNSRNVWTIAPRAFREAHFATFPPELAERCIKAGTPLTVCHLCGEAKLPADCGGICAGLQRDPGRVLDPFGGAGTVGLVAQRLGLDCTLIELNAEYADMARKRIEADLMPASPRPGKRRNVARETSPNPPETPLPRL